MGVESLLAPEYLRIMPTRTDLWSLMPYHGGSYPHRVDRRLRCSGPLPVLTYIDEPRALRPVVVAIVVCAVVFVATLIGVYYLILAPILGAASATN